MSVFSKLSSPKLLLLNVIKSASGFFFSFPSRVILLLVRLGVVSTYQPFFAHPSGKASRNCIDRWELIKTHLPTTPYSFLDIGSQIGFFTFSAAAHGAKFAFGVERVKNYLMLARSILIAKKIKNVSFLELDLSEETVKASPSVNATCCLSVFHHWIIQYGFDTADDIFTQLCNKTEVIFFETGQSNEKNLDWTDTLSFMGASPETWIENYLQQKGFSFVKLLGYFDTHLTPTKRALFVAKK